MIRESVEPYLLPLSDGFGGGVDAAITEAPSSEPAAIAG
jgi:hypothetical protein